MATPDETFWTTVVVPILTSSPERAVALLRDELSRAPSQSSRDWMQLAIGNILAANPQQDEAIAEFRTIVTRNETECASLAQLAIAISYIRSGDEEAAIGACQDLLQMFPKSSRRLSALSWLCRLARRQGDQNLLASTMVQLAQEKEIAMSHSGDSPAPLPRFVDIDLCIADGRLQDAIALLRSEIEEERVRGGDSDVIAILEARIIQLQDEPRGSKKHDS